MSHCLVGRSSSIDRVLWGDMVASTPGPGDGCLSELDTAGRSDERGDLGGSVADDGVGLGRPRLDFGL